MALVWRTADDVVMVHRLIEASDRRAAALTGTTAPPRRQESTQRLVAAGQVQLGLVAGQPVVTVTVGPVPSFDPAEAGMPEADEPWYMQRLAVAPDYPDGLVGFHAVRHAVQLAAAAGADALRAEANPDLSAVLTMLTAVGFRRYRTHNSGRAPRTYLQLVL
ncbi:MULTISPECIES: hypothetical protein [Rhodococcus]|uniref:N-acetyltransferase domain-containing protein n=1 Tax=Rhodococcus opacus RKJ300 = JCM 13270 TaxID=1165867 RepID=I0WTR4_RHOOP|nr:MULTISPECIES: hypothetical protein [Rhodococcus]EID79780.1 hypothetical protein W59_11711 [Rhodococcus opacus RKJ300 = JCM 13270]KAF0961819.1 hypothetical protein MLGJGCBP_05044 [Rhodococcus sp. T7]QQZ18260.1 hypothetical protein GO592_39170 [Rhodococcus sp. 21391]UOT08195.1 hypothetical protein MPY17_38280 [Rhodococcus opacus]